MGVLDAAMQRGRRLRGLSWHSGTRRVAHITFEGMDTPYSFELGISQCDTEEALVEHLLQLGVTVERRVRFSNLEQDALGVTASLQHADGTAERLRVPWLVGCDGAGSAVRGAIGLAWKGLTYEDEGLHADVQISWPPHFPVPENENLFFLGPPGFMAALPLREPGSYRLVFLLRPGDGSSRERTIANLQVHAAQRGPTGIQISSPAWIDTFRIHRRMVDKYRVGRVFLAGDAAHVHSPFGGQGISLGIQDAHNLAWRLALVIRGVGCQELLDCYETERRPLAVETLRSTHATTLLVQRLSSLRSPILRGLRDEVIAFVTSRSRLQREAGPALGMLTRNYRHSPLCLEDWPSSASTGGPSAGDRAPDARQLLRRPVHTLLLFTNQDLLQLADETSERYSSLIEPVLIVQAKRVPEGLSGIRHRVILDADGALHRRYGAKPESLYLLRPDGYIGYRSQPADRYKLAAYLQRIFWTAQTREEQAHERC